LIKHNSAWEEKILDNSTLDKETYEKMFNLASEILCVSYFSGRFKYVNSAFNDVFGYSTDEVEELNMFSIIHPDDKNILNNAILLAGEDGQDVVNLQFRYKCKDGKFKWISWNLKFDCDKGITYAAGNDISNRMDLEQTVYEGNEKLKAIIENISEALFICDSEGNYTTFNKSARNIFPFTFHNFNKIGDSLEENKYYDISGNLVKHEDMPGFRILRGEKILGYRVMKINNSATFYDIKGSPIYDDKGNFIAGVQCWNDVTETVLHEKILQGQFDFLQNMIHNMDLPFVRFSCLDFSIMDINQKAINIIEGINHEMNSIDIVIGQKYTDIITWFDKDDMFKHFKMIKEKKEKSYQSHRQLTVFGEKKFIKSLYQPIFGLDGEISEVIVIVIDVTKEIRAKLELEKHLRMQEEFFVNISHELKTPLNVIYTTIQLFDLYRKSGSLIENQDKLEKYINVIKQNCYRQIKLVNNLVDLSKIESGFFQLYLSNQNIVSVIEDIVQSVSEHIKANDISIVFDTNVEEKIIACDAEKIERVILNIISNGIKFTNPNGEIFINLLDKGDNVEIEVKDTGIGIDKEHVANIFERFHQVDKSLSRNAEGSGIGLSLVKSIVELHGGKISVDSMLGEGTIFKIELPARTVINEKVTEQIKTRSNKIEMINIEFSDIYAV
jgi:PAS domain S-box-containing protein